MPGLAVAHRTAGPLPMDEDVGRKQAARVRGGGNQRGMQTRRREGQLMEASQSKTQSRVAALSPRLGERWSSAMELSHGASLHSVRLLVYIIA